MAAAAEGCPRPEEERHQQLLVEKEAPGGAHPRLVGPGAPVRVPLPLLQQRGRGADDAGKNGGAGGGQQSSVPRGHGWQGRQGHRSLENKLRRVIWVAPLAVQAGGAEGRGPGLADVALAVVGRGRGAAGPRGAEAGDGGGRGRGRLVLQLALPPRRRGGGAGLFLFSIECFLMFELLVICNSLHSQRDKCHKRCRSCPNAPPQLESLLQHHLPPIIHHCILCLFLGNLRNYNLDALQCLA
mmetsp:Transcript_14558/g.20135  ORF Transcript_14558/g.20135 Transcript_14558/m.20135 type:complete len:241 (-) Transcript_14558:752-1474(-)